MAAAAFMKMASPSPSPSPTLLHHNNKLVTGYRQCLAMKFNHPPKFGIFFVAPAAPQFGICFAAPAAPPPSEAAPSSGTPPPEEESPNPVMNFVKTINKDYGEITKMNKLIKSFEAYPKFWNLIIGVLTIGYGLVDQHKESLQKFKKIVVKNRTYLAIAILIVAAAFISIKKGGPKAGNGKKGGPKAGNGKQDEGLTEQDISKGSSPADPEVPKKQQIPS